MKNNRVNIDRDVQSRKSIAESRPAPRKRETPRTEEPPKDEPKEQPPQEEPKETDAPDADAQPAPKAKKGGRSATGDV
jgi:hypothetical protein